MDLRANKWHKVGAAAYVLWGILHILVGVFPVARFIKQGPAAMLASLEGVTAVPSTVGEPLLQASHLVAEHYFNLIAVGLMAIMVAVALNWKGKAFGFWLNLVVLGLVDIAFVFGELLPRYMPLMPGAIGPALYLLGALFTGLGLLSQRRRTPA